MTKRSGESVPKKMQPIYDEITRLTDDFCQAHLNEEYATMCRKLTAKLSRKRPSPLVSGRANTWAAAIAYTIGRVNFAFDRSQTPHTSASELSQHFGRNKSTVANKSKQIMDLLKIGIMEPEWTLPSKLYRNPMAWFISVNGFIMDARHAPREIQEAAYRKGLIPYIPAERPGKSP